LAYFYGEQQLFNGNVDLKAGRISVRNDFGTLPGTCFDFMSLSICANPSSTSNLSWTVFPVASVRSSLQQFRPGLADVTL
jgi:carbohydrate-selective porin OprB